jgi:hypothetical protein
LRFDDGRLRHTGVLFRAADAQQLPCEDARNRPAR